MGERTGGWIGVTGADTGTGRVGVIHRGVSTGARKGDCIGF
jgi:hypothetical protein